LGDEAKCQEMLARSASQVIEAKPSAFTFAVHNAALSVQSQRDRISARVASNCASDNSVTARKALVSDFDPPLLHQSQSINFPLRVGVTRSSL
jgi:hypothetical protein